MGGLSVLLADDHAIVRQGLRALIEAEPDLNVVGEAANGQEAVALARETSPDVVLMDVAMPQLNGIQATRQILSEAPRTKVLVLTSYSNDDFVKQMVEAGVSGYLTKQTAAQELIRAIREVQKGNAFFSPSIARRLRDQSRGAFGRRPPALRATQLTPRETQVLQLISQGYANKQMAAELGISVKTIEKHRQHVMKKLDIHDIASLTRYAAEKGYCDTKAPEPGAPHNPNAAEPKPGVTVEQGSAAETEVNSPGRS